MIAAAGDVFGAFGFLFLGLLVLALGVLWIIFPLLVLSKFNELLKVQRAIHAALQSANTARAEIADEEQTKRQQAKSSPPSLGARQVIADPTYHYAAEGEQIGPYTSHDIREFCDAGVITNDTLLIKDGDTQWKPLSEFAEFTSLPHGTKET